MRDTGLSLSTTEYVQVVHGACVQTDGKRDSRQKPFLKASQEHILRNIPPVWLTLDLRCLSQLPAANLFYRLSLKQIESRLLEDYVSV